MYAGVIFGLGALTDATGKVAGGKNGEIEDKKEGKRKGGGEGKEKSGGEGKEEKGDAVARAEPAYGDDADADEAHIVLDLLPVAHRFAASPLPFMCVCPPVLRICRYGVAELVDDCGAFLANSIAIDNVLERFMVADLHGASFLKVSHSRRMESRVDHPRVCVAIWRN